MWKVYKSRRLVYVRDSQESCRLEQEDQGSAPKNELEGSVEMGHLSLGCSSWHVGIKPYLASTRCHHCVLGIQR